MWLGVCVDEEVAEAGECEGVGGGIRLHTYPCVGGCERGVDGVFLLDRWTPCVVNGWGDFFLLPFRPFFSSSSFCHLS